MKGAGLSLTVLVLAMLLFPTSSPAQVSGHYVHPPLPGQELCLFYEVEGADARRPVDVALNIPAPVAPAELDQLIRVPALGDALRVTRYLPRATLEQSVVADDSGRRRGGLTKCWRL